MPLRLSRRPDSSVWWITGTVNGERIRRSSGTADRRVAEELRVNLEAGIHRARIYGVRAVVTWEQAVASYIEANPPSPGTAAFLLRLTDHLGRTPLAEIDQARADTAIAALTRPNAAPATKLRNVIVPLRAVLSHAARRQWCDPPILETPKGAAGTKRTRWLTPAEFLRLRTAAAPHLRPLLTYLVCTGARLSEALELPWRDVDLAHARATMRVKDPRDPDRRRVADLFPAAVEALSGLPVAIEARLAFALGDGPVFLTDDLRPYADHGRAFGGQIGTAFAGAVRRAQLSRDVTPHVLRHTFASWHYCAWRDPMKLRDDGDWSSIALVERYAKLAPASLRPEVLRVWGLS